MALSQLVCYFTVFLALGTRDHKQTQVMLCQDFWVSTLQMAVLEIQVDSAIKDSNPVLHDKM